VRVGPGAPLRSAAYARVAIFALAVLAASSPLAAQGLDEVEVLIHRGAIAEARRELDAWWAQDRTAAAPFEVQRGIWFRGLLTVEGDGAELHYRRLLLEYPSGPFTDLALARLGHLAHAKGADAEAEAHFRQLLRDHPTSFQGEDARRWLVTYGAGGSGAGGGSSAGVGPSTPSTPSTPSAPPAAPPATVTPSTSAPTDPATRPRWAVQIGAFGAMAGAQALADRARSVGLEPRLVLAGTSPLVRVRVGAFFSEGEARAFLSELRERGFEATLTADADGETPVQRDEALL
jgi:hypothetical protein